MIVCEKNFNAIGLVVCLLGMTKNCEETLRILS